MVSGYLEAMAVGGPADGKIIAGRDGVTVYFVSENVSVAYDEMPTASVNLRHVYYRETNLAIRAANGDELIFKFWVYPNAIKDKSELLRALVSGYRPIVPKIIKANDKK